MAWNLEIFNSLFKGRSEVFTIRWERDSKTGYMPAYILDCNEYKLHKTKDGTLKDFTNKQYQDLAGPEFHSTNRKFQRLPLPGCP